MNEKEKLDWSAKEDMTHGITITIDGAVVATVDGTDEKAKALAKHIVKCWNERDPLVKIKEIAYEVACTGDQQAEDKLIGLIEDYEAALAAEKERKE